MTDETKTAEATKTVDDIKSRMVFDSPAAALSYIGEISDYEGFGDLQQAIVGLLVDDDGNPVVDDEGNPRLDPAIYDSTMQVAVAVLSEKDTGAKKLVPVGLAVYPTPAPEAVAATEEGAKWIAKLVEKESNLIAMRALRKDGADYETAVESMPRTIAAYITPTREAATGIMATFEALWRDIKKLMGQKSRAWTIANFSKKELRRAVESARSEEHTSELQSLMRISYAVFCLKKKNNIIDQSIHTHNAK